MHTFFVTIPLTGPAPTKLDALKQLQNSILENQATISPTFDPYFSPDGAVIRVDLPRCAKTETDVLQAAMVKLQQMVNREITGAPASPLYNQSSSEEEIEEDGDGCVSIRLRGREFMKGEVKQRYFRRRECKMEASRRNRFDI
ncbi:hypothetical protein AWENTII_008189 [Aspergillus wentii]|nr:hypothetical protein MW887_002500 [Aspergillus wentii]